MNVTIIIILHNRHQNIARLMEYYNDTDAQFILADSSTTPHPAQQLPSQWKHLYTPGISYTQKIETALTYVNTDYVIFCADDDFIIPEAIEKCEQFLNQHPAYATTQGHCLCFRKNELLAQGPIGFYPIYSYLNYAYEKDDSLCRIDDLLSNYKSLLYAVHRTHLLKEAYAGASAHITHLYLNEYNASILPLSKGKYKELDFLYQVREYAEDSDDKTAVNINTIINDPKQKHHLNSFINHIVTKLPQEVTQQTNNSSQQILKGLQTLASCVEKNNRLKPSFKKKVGAIVGRIPFLGRRIIEASRKTELNKQLSTIVKTEAAQTELEKIKSLLKKYGV